MLRAIIQTRWTPEPRVLAGTIQRRGVFRRVTGHICMVCGIDIDDLNLSQRRVDITVAIDFETGLLVAVPTNEYVTALPNRAETVNFRIE
jgi:hypothetical protein